MVGMLTLDHPARLAKLARPGFLAGTLQATQDTIQRSAARAAGSGSPSGGRSWWPRRCRPSVGNELFAAVRNVAVAFQSFQLAERRRGCDDRVDRRRWPRGHGRARGLGGGRERAPVGRPSVGACSRSGPTAPTPRPGCAPRARRWPLTYALATGVAAWDPNWFFGSPSPRGALGAPSTIGLLRVDLARAG